MSRTNRTTANTANETITIAMPSLPISSASTLRPYAADVSDKYVVIDTERVVLELQKRGFVLRDIKQAKTGKGRHVVRMRTENFTEINGEKLFPEIVIQNSYDKKCGFSVETGIFRLVCSNGLTVRVKGTEGGFYKTTHIGNPAKIAEQIALDFVDQLGNVWGIHQKLAAKKLTDKQMIALAMRAAQIRWNKIFTAVEAKKLLASARPEDDGNTAWLVFNRLQEWTIQGGVKLDGHRTEPKPVNVPRKHATINAEIFDAVFEMVETGKLAPRPLKSAVVETAEILENAN